MTILSRNTESIIGSVISADHFSFKNKVFVTEASQLRGSSPFGSLYNDAADVGFLLHSSKTDSAVPFYLSSVDKSGDEIAGWRFKSAGNTPSTADLELLIIND